MADGAKKHQPHFDLPERPASTIHQRIISHSVISELGPEQARNLKVTKDFNNKQVTYHTIKGIYNKHSKNRKTRLDALRATMTKPIEADKLESEMSQIRGISIDVEDVPRHDSPRM